jgi:hypothetical protein
MFNTKNNNNNKEEEEEGRMATIPKHAELASMRTKERTITHHRHHLIFYAMNANAWDIQV